LFSNFCCKAATVEFWRAATLVPVVIVLLPALDTAFVTLAKIGGFISPFIIFLSVGLFKLTDLCTLGTLLGKLGFFSIEAPLFNTSGDFELFSMFELLLEQLVTKSGLLDVGLFGFILFLGDGGAGLVGDGFLVRILGGVVCLFNGFAVLDVGDGGVILLFVFESSLSLEFIVGVGLRLVLNEDAKGPGPRCKAEENGL